MMTVTDEINSILNHFNPEVANVINRLNYAIEELSLNIAGGYERYVDEENDLRRNVIRLVNMGNMYINDAAYLYYSEIVNRSNEYLFRIGIQVNRNLTVDVVHYIYVIETINDIKSNNYEDNDILMDIIQNDEFDNVVKLSKMVSLLKPVEETTMLEVLVKVNDDIMAVLSNYITNNERERMRSLSDPEFDKVLLHIDKSGEAGSLLLTNYNNGFFNKAKCETPFDMFNQNVESVIINKDFDYLTNVDNLAKDLIFSIVIYCRKDINKIKTIVQQQLDNALDYTEVKLSNRNITINKEQIINNVRNYFESKIIKGR